MARRKKVVIVDEELTPTVLAIRANKKKTSVFSIIWIILIFAVFIGGVYYLPDISKYVSNYLNPEDLQDFNPTVSNNDNEDDETKITVVEYKIAESPVITEENFTLSDFKINNNQISFLVTNTSSDILDLEEYNYFLSLYNDANTLLQRIMVTDGVVPVGNSITLSFDLVDEAVSVLTFINISTEDYPAHIVNSDENGSATLICKKDNETVNYSLTNNKVYAIQDIFEVSIDNPNYAVLYSTYQALATTYQAIGGVTSNVTVENNILYFRTLVNLNTTVDNAINNKVIYAKDTDAKIMNFEMEASGYDCN